MREYTLTHLSDTTVIHNLAALVARDQTSTAMLLAYIAEIDVRKLYAPAGCPSLFAYCTEELHMSEDVACKRIAAARAARTFPMLFLAIAEGRLHVSGVTVLAPHLTTGNVEELIKAATHRKKSEIEEMIARRSSPAAIGASIRPRVLARVRRLPATTSSALSAPGRVAVRNLPLLESPQEDSSTQVESHPQKTEQGTVQATERFLVQFTMEKADRDLLQYVQGLLSHAVPSADVGEVFLRALRSYSKELEKRRFAAVTRERKHEAKSTTRASQARAGDRSAGNERYVPAPVRRAVWERDQGRCTFVGTSGKRCTATRFLEFDHIDPVARGGRSTVERMRLRCRAHNQYDAERVFGAGFMERKRQEARA